MAWVTWPTFQILGTPLISLERPKIETSYFAYWLTLRDTKQKNCKKMWKGGMAGVTWPTIKFWDPSNISGTAEGRNLKFCMQIEVRAYQTKNVKNGQKWAWPGSRDLLFKFWDPPNISGTAKARNLKFCMQIDVMGHTLSLIHIWRCRRRG